jgi:tetratricopeptide (TPR) repeat protein
MQQLNTIFPRPDDGDKITWARYLPHAMIALKFHDDSSNQVLSSRLLSKAALGLRHLRKFTDAKQMNEQALALQTKVLGPEHPETLVIMNDHIILALHEGQYKEAEQIGQKVVNLRRKELGPEHPETLESINDFTVALQYQGKRQEAEQINQQTLELCRKTLGAEHPSNS